MLWKYEGIWREADLRAFEQKGAKDSKGATGKPFHNPWGVFSSISW
jgi:hypothetical protein